MQSRVTLQLLVGAVVVALGGVLATTCAAAPRSGPGLCGNDAALADDQLLRAVRATTVPPPPDRLSRGASWIRAETCARLGGDLACARYIPRLEAGDQGIESLRGAECLQALRHLVISGNQLTSLEPLAGLTHLQALDATRNAIADLTPLRGLSRLRELYLWNNAIRDATPLAQLPSLEVVDLRTNRLDCGAQRDLLATLRNRGVRVLDDCGTSGASEPATSAAH